MPLLSRTKFPPGGFPYFEPRLNWRAPSDGAPFTLRVTQMMKVRAANPSSGLNPSREACSDDLDAYTCARLGNDPQWCVSVANPVMAAITTTRKSVGGCGGCGSRRKARAK